MFCFKRLKYTKYTNILTKWSIKTPSSRSYIILYKDWKEYNLWNFLSSEMMIFSENLKCSIFLFPILSFFFFIILFSFRNPISSNMDIWRIEEYSLKKVWEWKKWLVRATCKLKFYFSTIQSCVLLGWHKRLDIDLGII